MGSSPSREPPRPRSPSPIPLFISQHGGALQALTNILGTPPLHPSEFIEPTTGAVTPLFERLIRLTLKQKANTTTAQSLPPTLSRKSKILTQELAYILNDHIQSPTWMCKYSSQVQGESWTQFLDATENSPGENIIIVKSGEDVFGVWTQEDWIIDPKIRGGKTFVFKNGKIWHSSKPVQYLQSGAATLINGLGIGQNIEYFGLFISPEFTVQSNSCSTYESPCLNYTTEAAHIDTLELWSTRPRQLTDLEIAQRDKKYGKGFRANPDLIDMMELAGKKVWTKKTGEDSVPDAE